MVNDPQHTRAFEKQTLELSNALLWTRAAAKHLCGSKVEHAAVDASVLFKCAGLTSSPLPAQYHKTIEAVYSVENSVETLLDLLQRYREKAGDKVAEKGGSIFTKACFLLALLLQDKQRTEEVKKLPKVLDRIHSIYRLTARKHKMDTERTIIKQKMSASINGSFFVPATPRKSRAAPKFAPDWVLRRDKLKDIVDPLRAIQVVANTLSIVL
ncbi:unnamed protein product [Oreochromis niloticus]|nr:unnamed protein product [Mustela putorius furo]